MSGQRWLVLALLVLSALFCGMLYLAGFAAPKGPEQRRALGIARMATGLVVIWIWACGGLIYWYRDRIRARVQALGLNWRLGFVLSCTLHAKADRLQSEPD